MNSPGGIATISSFTPPPKSSAYALALFRSRLFTLPLLSTVGVTKSKLCKLTGCGGGVLAPLEPELLPAELEFALRFERLGLGVFFGDGVRLGGGRFLFALAFGVSLPVPPWPSTNTAQHAENKIIKAIADAGQVLWFLIANHLFRLTTERYL